MENENVNMESGKNTVQKSAQQSQTGRPCACNRLSKTAHEHAGDMEKCCGQPGTQVKQVAPFDDSDKATLKVAACDNLLEALHTAMAASLKLRLKKAKNKSKASKNQHAGENRPNLCRSLLPAGQCLGPVPVACLSRQHLGPGQHGQ